MAVRVVNLHKTAKWEWDGDPDKGTEDATKFEFRPLDGFEQAYLNDRLTSLEGGSFQGDTEEELAGNLAAGSLRTELYKVAMEAFRIALVGVENLRDEEDKIVEYASEHASINGKTKKIAASSITRAISPILALAAYRKIMEMSVVSKSAEKNSASA